MEGTIQNQRCNESFGSCAAQMAERLDLARVGRQEIARITLELPTLDLPQAYEIQEKGMEYRYARGEKWVGFKVGLTSKAKREQMNLHLPIYGELTDRMQISDGGQLSLKEWIHPKVEPEVAFVIGKEISGPLSFEDAFQACSGVCAALEILDSRFKDFKYFSLPDVVADNSSSALFVLSSQITPFRPEEIANSKMILSVNGTAVQEGVTAAISEHPIWSLVELSKLLSERGRKIPAGSIVLAGAATQAVQLQAGMKVSLSVEGLGSVSVGVE